MILVIVMIYDIAIIGAGPAGSTAARICAKAGLKVALFEEHEEIGNPLACGEGMSIDKIKELGIPIKSVTTKFGNEKNSQKGNFNYIERDLKYQRFFFLDAGIAVSRLDVVTIDRPMFDRFLAANAEKEGASIFTGERVENIKTSEEHISFQTFKENNLIQEKVTAKLLIACDGPSSRIPKELGLKSPSKYVQGVEVKVKGVFTDALDFYFDHDLFPMGYGWVFPKIAETNIGLVVKPANEPRERLEQFLERLKSEFGIEEFEIIKDIAGIIPASGPIEKSYTNRALVVGDSGGFTNSIFYGGIAIAIHTAQLAALTAIEAVKQNNFSEEFLKKYEDKWKKMPYASEKVQIGHNALYNKITNKELKLIGKLMDSKDITTLGKVNKFKLLFKVATNKTLRAKKKDLIDIVNGFRNSRDWGF